MSLPEVPVIGVWGRSRHDNAMLINTEREPIANEDPDLAESQIYSDRVREPLIPRSRTSETNGSTSHSYNLSDNKNFVYFAFYLMGMATLLPWNFFITANDYWMYKLRDLDTNQTHNATELSNLQASFTSYLCITSLIPSTLILWLNAIIGHKFTFKTRIVGGLVAVIFFFALTTVFVKINTDQWQRWFFGLTLATAILLNGTGAMFQGGLFALVGKFPPRYVSAVVSGQALGGLFASAANLTSIALGASAVQSAFLYFLAADVTLVLTLVCYTVAANTQCFRGFSTSSGVVQQIYDNPAINEDSSEKYYQESDDTIVVVKEVSCGMIRKIWTYAVSITAIFMVTLSIFPSVTERVRPMDSSHSAWHDLYYTPVACFLIMNVGDYVGRVLAGYLNWPKPGSPMVPTLSFMRMAFIPLVMFCNVQPRHHLPLLLPWDAAFMVIMALFSLSNGYLNTVCFMHAPELVHPADQEKASSFMAAMLGLGLALGGTLSNLMVRIV